MLFNLKKYFNKTNTFGNDNFHFWNNVIDKIANESIIYCSPNCLSIDDKYFSGLIIIEYPRVIERVIIDKLFEFFMDINIVMYYEQVNNYNIIKNLSYYLGNIKTEIKSNANNKEDFELLETTYDDVRYIRRELQINNEKIYNYYMYITISEDKLEVIKEKIAKIKNIIYGLGFIARTPVYRLIGLYKSILPFNNNVDEIKFDGRKSMLTKNLSVFYPFNSDVMCDLHGILFGCDEKNKKIKIIDRFDRNKYINGNMCVFGTSGVGKSYFVKLQILRNAILNITQLVIDPEGEYSCICSDINGVLFDFNNGVYINIFDIYVDNAKESFLENKIKELITFFEIIIPNITNNQKVYLESVIIKVYKQKGITHDNKTLYFYEKNNKVLVKPILKTGINIPKIEDLYNIIKEDKKDIDLEYQLKPFVKGSLAWFNNYSNYEINKKTIFFNISSIKDEYLDLYIYAIIQLSNAIIKRDFREKKAIYIDELWKLVGRCTNDVTANFVIQIFKTIRKYNGVATAITQDVYDLIINDLVYGKTIVNNSLFVCLFKQGNENIENIKNIIGIQKGEKNIVFKLKRGQCLLKVNNNSVIIDVNSSEYEKNLIESGGVNA